MQKKKTPTILIVLLVLLGFGASACEKIREEPRFGEAFEHQRLSQQLNPGPKDDTPVVGLDGRLSRNVYMGYIDPAETEKQRKTASDFMLLMESEK